MYVPAHIQSLIDHARALSVEERRALRTELLQAAAAMGLPVPKPKSTGPTVRSRWPRIGGADLVVAPNLTVETDAYQARWEASDVVVWVYVLGCPGLQELAQLLDLPLFKIGTTEGSLQDRLHELGRDNYGASYRTPTGLVREPGFGPGMWVAEQTPRHARTVAALAGAPVRPRHRRAAPRRVCPTQLSRSGSRPKSGRPASGGSSARPPAGHCASTAASTRRGSGA